MGTESSFARTLDCQAAAYGAGDRGMAGGLRTIEADSIGRDIELRAARTAWRSADAAIRPTRCERPAAIDADAIGGDFEVSSVRSHGRRPDAAR